MAIEPHLADVIVLDEIDNVPLTVEAYAGLAQPPAWRGIEIDITLQGAVAVGGEALLLACEQVPDIDVGVTIAVADEIEPPVVAAERRTGEIEQLGVEAVSLAIAAAHKNSFRQVV